MREENCNECNIPAPVVDGLCEKCRGQYVYEDDSMTLYKRTIKETSQGEYPSTKAIWK